MKNRRSRLVAIGLFVSLVAGSQAALSSSEHCDTLSHSALQLPAGLPQNFSLVVPFGDRQYTLHLEKNDVFGENTRFLIADGVGGLKEIELGLDRSYLGWVAERSDFTVSAVLTEKGLIASILRPGEESITIEPVRNANEGLLHTIAVGNSDDYQQNREPVEIVAQEGMAASSSSITTVPMQIESAGIDAAPSTATLPPSRVMEVLEYEIGVEIGSKSFLSSEAYNSNLAYAQSIAQGMMSNLDARFLRSAGIKHRLGTVIIRTDAATDPLRDSVTSITTASLSAFRDYWNSNTNEVGTTHDLAVYHVKSAPSGLAWVNSVGSANRYALSCGNGATSWANGTISHEFGHSWNLRHVGDIDGFVYESKPRSNSGSHSAGGEDVFVSIMHGGGSHNIGRVSSGEAERVYNARQNKQSYGDLVSEPGEIAPFGNVDYVSVFGVVPHALDVIENDYDCNNDVLDVRLLDTVSQLGATISLSEGTGPGGRNELLYTPIANPPSPNDFFHYTVVDSTGKTDWGCVYVNYEGYFVVDTSATSFKYDLGPGSSPVDGGMTALTPNAYRDIYWSGDPIIAVDRNPGGSVSDTNRDFISGSGVSILNHKIGNGVWEMSMTMGDAEEELDLMVVKAEGETIVLDASSATGSYFYVYGTVTVRDGELNLEFSDAGGTNDTWVINRISLTKVGDLITVDTSATSYDYDLGPSTSPVMSGWTGISEGVGGDVFWSGDSVYSYDDNPGGGVNDINRDSIYGTGVTTLNHKIANGVWDITLNMGEAGWSHSNMVVRAEGVTIGTNVTAAAGTFPYVRGTVTVLDGELNLDFFGVGGGYYNYWAATRLSLVQISGAPTAFDVDADVKAGESVGITLRGSGTGTLTYTLMSQPDHGTISGSGANLTYTAELTYSGTDTFTYKVSNDSYDSAVATVSIDVEANLDYDNDGLPNDWEQQHFSSSTAADPHGDPDADQIKNLAEYAFGGNPTNSSLVGSLPYFEMGRRGMGCTYSLRNDPGLKLIIMSCTDLVAGNWITNSVNNGVSGEGFSSRASALPNEDCQFVKWKIEK